MKKNLLAASVFVATLSLLPGCGSKKEEVKEVTVEAVEVAPVAEEAAPEVREEAPVEMTEEAK